MALNKSALINDIKYLLTDMMKKEEDSFDEFANRLASAIDDYVKKAEIDYISGLTNQGGPVVGTFNGKLK